MRKHGVRFDDAMLAFGDRFALFEQDRVVGEELRWQALGSAGGNFFTDGRSHCAGRRARRNNPDHFGPQSHPKGTKTL